MAKCYSLLIHLKPHLSYGTSAVSRDVIIIFNIVAKIKSTICTGNIKH